MADSQATVAKETATQSEEQNLGAGFEEASMSWNEAFFTHDSRNTRDKKYVVPFVPRPTWPICAPVDQDSLRTRLKVSLHFSKMEQLVKKIAAAARLETTVFCKVNIDLPR